jgi:hypothetical protein
VQNCCWIAAALLFGPGLPALLKQLNEALAAQAHANPPRHKNAQGFLGVLCGLACKTFKETP